MKIGAIVLSPRNGKDGALTKRHVAAGDRSRGRVFAALFLCAIWIPAASAQTNQDWYSLSPERARQGQPVELEGTVVCYDSGWEQLYIYNDHRVDYLNPRAFTNDFRLGQRVKIHGITTWDGNAAALTNLTSSVIGHLPLPRAPLLKVKDLGGLAGQWVGIQGTVRTAEASHDRVTLMVADGDQKCLVYVMGTSSTSRYKQLANAKVDIQGINASQIEGGKLTAAKLFCPGLNEVTVIAPPAEDPWTLPVIPIDTLLSQPLGSWTNDPVHINGIVAGYRPGEMLSIKDPTGILRAEVIQVNSVLSDQRVDCWGYLAIQTNGAVLKDAYFEAAGKTATVRSPVAHIPRGRRVFNSIKDVRALSKEEANGNFPATVRGIVTFADPEWHVGFLQDNLAPIYFGLDQTNLQVGDLVEVQGQTDGSGFAPGLINCSAQVLSRPGLPVPLPVDLQDTAGGQLDSRWVELEGVVRHVAKQYGRISMTMAGRDGKFTATVLDFDDSSAPTELVDCLVRVRGVCGSVVNSRGQMSGVFLHVPSRSQIKVVEAAAADPFSAVAVPISMVATFQPERLSGRRVKISGVVTLVTPARDLFVQDASGGVRVVNSGTNRFRIGERVEILGFPTLSDFSPCLEEAAIRGVGLTNLPPPRPTTAAHVLQEGDGDGMRIELQAQVIQSYAKSARAKLLLQSGPIIFLAQVAQPDLESAMPDWAAGSLVKLRGVCVIQGNENNEPTSFHVLLADPADVTLLKGASWWTLEHMIFLLGGTTLASLLTLLWVFLLRHQVRRQTEVIRQNQKQLLESSRLAGMAEIATNVLHNVGNVLNSVNISASIVSDKVSASPAAKGLTDVVGLIEKQGDQLAGFIANDPRGKYVPIFLKQLAERLRAENAVAVEELASLTKNIGHIKDIVASQQGLAKVCGILEKVAPKELMEDALQVSTGGGASVGLTITRDYAPVLDDMIVEKHKLMQILVNLISNAKNACVESGKTSREITLGLAQEDGQLKLWVQDNGIGIAPDNLVRIFHHGFTTRKNGHGFGLHSGALFAQQLGGRLRVQSDGLGQGARFTIELPLDAIPRQNLNPHLADA